MVNVKFGLSILVLVVLGATAFFFFQTQNSSSRSPSSNNEASWVFDYNTKAWQVTGNPAECPEAFIVDPPVDISLASGILYPGQIRGNNYKPHGGFRFDNRNSNDIEARAIMDGYILKASRYEDGEDIQNLLFYVNECGIMVMHDHLLTLSPKLNEVFDKLPLNKNGDTRTTFIEPKVYLKKGDLIATEIGYKDFEGRKNIFVDFGLYDLRRENRVKYDDVFRQKHPNINEYGTHALCWFDYLSPESEALVRGLPAGGYEGKISDYCN